MKALSLCFIFLLFLCFAAEAQESLSNRITIKTFDSLLLPKAPLPAIPKLLDDETTRPRNEDENKLIDYVEMEAAPVKGWKDYLKNGLQPCIDSVVKKGLAAGTYIILAKLLIDKDGTIAKAELQNDLSFGFCHCFETLLYRGPKWQPKYVMGRRVTAITVQKIIFTVPDKADE